MRVERPVAGAFAYSVMLETNQLPIVVALHVTTNILQDKLLRTSPDSSLFHATFAREVVDADRISTWAALALINTLAVIGTIAWSRRRFASAR
ncbi:MAG TPA: hypothetical protein VGO61_11675 [Steroidobacteraceae bacterium]|nr:hypothetical protein [Steroidobacteraceae bacterium]